MQKFYIFLNHSSMRRFSFYTPSFFSLFPFIKVTYIKCQIFIFIRTELKFIPNRMLPLVTGQPTLKFLPELQETHAQWREIWCPWPSRSGFWRTWQPLTEQQFHHQYSEKLLLSNHDKFKLIVNQKIQQRIKLINLPVPHN